MPYMLRLMVCLLLLAAAAPALRAQTDAQLTQYWAMPAYYNAGAAGTTDYLRINGAARLQWLGIENAPKSFMGVADMPFRLMGKRLGTGVNLMQESLGLFSNLQINVQLAYSFKLFGGNLSIGFQPGYFTQKFKGSEVILPDDDDYHEGTDEAIPTQDLTGHTFDFSAGLFYQHKLFWVGLSGTHLLNPNVTMSLEGSESTVSQEYYTELTRMLYLMAGGNIPLKNTLFELQPSMLLKTDLNMFTAELTMRAQYSRFLSFGLGYRWNDALSVMIGAELKGFFVGYAYDYPINKIAKATSGSHELTAGYRLKFDFKGKNKNKHRSIRIM